MFDFMAIECRACVGANSFWRQSKQKKLNIIILLIVFLVIVFLAGCQMKHIPSSTADNPTAGIPLPDYAEKGSWLALPDDPDKHPVDVLWFYPTVVEEGNMLMDYRDPSLQKAAQDTIEHQASVFTDSANLYAPFYRQLNINGFRLKLDKINELLAYGEGDMWRAIEYYLEHYNNGRPFIIAAHSQGSSNLLDILKKNWGTTGKENQLVAAYLIGWSITPDDIAANTKIRICSKADDTNCFITYNSIKDGMQDKSIQIAKGTWVTNPLSWESSTKNGEVVPAEKNIGAVFFPAGKKPQTYPHFTSAQIKDSGLVCQVADESVISPSSMPKGIYHRDDYSLFYDNLKANAKERIEVFMLNQLKGKQLGVPKKLPAFDPEKDVPQAPDYADPDCWVAHPSFYDTKQQPVDVFWVYPTVLSDDTTYLMDPKDKQLREKAEWTLVEQASIFDGQANVYAPYYRQNNVKINPIMLTEAKPIFNLGQQDLIRAFDYFLKNFNKGERPIILAAHSQGSVRTVELSKAGELLTGDKDSLSKLVAAYTIGYSITPDDLKLNPLMRICRNATDTGCFIAYNTISDEPGKEKQGPTILPGTFVVNPLTWKTDETLAPARLNIGAAFFRHDDPSRPARFPHFCAAQKVGNALVITDVSNPEELPATSKTFPPGVYHMYDYAIFYENLKKNVADRIAAFTEKQ